MITRFARWWLGIKPPEAAAPTAPEPEPRASFFSTDVEDAEIKKTPAERARSLTARAFPVTVADTPTYSPALAADGALHTFAEDSSNYSESIKSVFRFNEVGIPDVQAAWYGSQGFIGYQLCAIIGQHWLVNKACLTPARDAVRKGYRFSVNDGTQVAPEVLTSINKANKRFRLNRSLIEFVKMSRQFGIRIAITLVDSDDPDYYVRPFNPDGIRPGSYRGMSQVDPYWCTPELTTRSASDPSALDFYEPTYWIINGKRYHKSHLVISRGPDVADILKPSYLYGGLSIPQLIYERVYAAERTANEAPQLALTKRAMIFYTDAAKALANQQAFEERLQTWAHFRDNFGVKVADKEADLIEQKDTSLADLDAVIMTQYQIVAGIAGMPVTKLMGTQLKGFSTGDGESDNYHEELESIQTSDMEPFIDRHIVCVIHSEIAPRFGLKPFTVECTFNPLDSLSTEGQANVNKIKAETDKVLVEIGAIDGNDARNRIAADEQSGHSGLVTYDDTETEGGENGDTQ